MISISAIVVLTMAQCGPGGCPRPIRQIPLVRVLPSESMAPRMLPPESLAPRFVLPGTTSMRTPRQMSAPPQAPNLEETLQKIDQDRDWGWHLVDYEGMIFPVWGYHEGDKTVRWTPSLPANVRQLELARALYNPAEREQQARKPQPRRRSL